MPAFFRFTKDDFDGDQKVVSWETKDVSDYADYAAYQTAMSNLNLEINKWSDGRDHKAEAVQILDDNGPGKATSPVAQGHIRVILEGQDTVNGQIYRYPIPMPALGKNPDAGTDPAWIAVGQGQNSLTVMNPDHADYATLKTQFESTVQSPNGNDVTLVRGYVEE